MVRIKSLALLLAMVLLLHGMTWAAVPDTESIPPDLEQWKPWVLHGKEERFCPIIYNNGQVHQCLWPARLKLMLDPHGGRFTQEWSVFVKDWAPLPGGSGVTLPIAGGVTPSAKVPPKDRLSPAGSSALWPSEVKVDGKSVPVLARGDQPAVELSPGKHVVEGAFTWERMPEMMNIPAASGLVSLTIDGAAVDFPVFDSAGRLWLHQRVAAGNREDRTEVKVFRLLNDTIPMQVTNLLKVNISGQAREVRFDGVLLEKATPMSIASPLPARLGPDGELLLQARPGHWEIQIVSRFAGPIQTLGPVKAAYGPEIWAFQAQNQLRMVQIDGVPGVDPKQTDSPRAWESFPTYVVQPDAVMIFKQIRRGDPEPAPDQLHLKRTWWLDFAGTGYTIQDQMDGAMSRHWALAMNPPETLGRVSVDGIDQLITSQGEARNPGVELRKGQLHLVAESRLEGAQTKLSAVSWDHDFESVSGVLHLPPGWRLLATRGVDGVPGAWLERWTLLDLFVVLIIALAVFKLWNWRWGVAALVAVGLTYHEPGAPRLVWLNLLAAVALLRSLPQGWARTGVNLYRLGALVALLVIALPFMVEQMRWGIYPQLEPVQASTGLIAELGFAPAVKPSEEAESPMGKAARRSMARPPAARALTETSKAKADYLMEQTALTQDPRALIQTGPGLPAWTWRSFALKWNGPVARGQQIRLWLLPPAVNLALALLRVLLLASLIALLLDIRQWKVNVQTLAGLSALLWCALLLPGNLAAAQTVAASPGGTYPPPELLQQLQNRLLEPPDCLPDCAASPRMELQVTTDSVRLWIAIHAAVETAIPLPGSTGSWLPETVLLDDQPAAGLHRDSDGQLWLLTPQGLHTVILLGKPRPGNAFQIPLPLRPHRTTIISKDWDVEGVHPDGQVEASLQLTRRQKDGTQPEEWTAATLPPFLQIERLLSLGLTWQVHTTVKRLTPPGNAVVVSVPLLPGEAVTTPGIRVEHGQALLNLEPNQNEIHWRSTLDTTPSIHLQAPAPGDAAPWTETWILDASPIWHCALAGIPVIHHQDPAGIWKPQWQPWPGESVTITVTRPEAIPGQSVTIDLVKLELTPGERYRKVGLTVRIRTSQGGQHRFTLAPDAQLQQVQIDGKSQPIQQQEREVVVPLQPGSQTILVEWLEGSTPALVTRGPEVSIGGPGQHAVNAQISFNLPRNRWILWTAGPRLGPAVLFWSYLLVVLVAAYGLGKVSWTPLKTRHWLLLGLGLTQTPPLIAILVAGWFLALGLREKHSFSRGWLYFDLTQLLLVVWTVLALGGLYSSIEQGLLGIPQMQIAGNGSSDFLLNWTQDRVGATLPQPWVLSLPLMVYRALMLLWALWLAWALLTWLRWGWGCFSQGELWRKVVLRHGKAAAAAVEQGAADAQERSKTPSPPG